MTKFSLRAVAALFSILFFTGNALAHHPMGGKTPETIVEGLLSGLGHPVIGVDHLAFIIAVGVLAGIARAPIWAPLLFVGGTLLGSIVLLSGVQFAFTEWCILASLLLLGVAMAMGFRAASTPVFGAIGFAGIFHGMAYADAVVGAETTPIVSYLVGFGVIQSLIALGAMSVVTFVWQRDNQPVYGRLTGAALAGFAAAFTIEGVEALLFAGIA